MKQLSDHLFEYALITGEEEVKLEEPRPLSAVFYDLPSEPVRIRETHSGHSVGIMMGNKKKVLDGKIESNRIGLQNIQKMMEKMGGRTVVEQNGPNFAVTLLFNIRMAGEAGHSLFSMLPPPTPSK